MLRLSALESLRAMTLAQREEKSLAIAAHLGAITGRVLGFFPMRLEPNWLAAGWPGEIALPRVEGDQLAFYRIGAIDDLVSGKLGTREPKADEAMRVRPETVDTILVPGLAFDRNGGRLGRGGGFYDRFLEQWPGIRLVGVCFSAQIFPTMKLESHDVRVGAIVTEDGWIDGRNSLSDPD